MVLGSAKSNMTVSKVQNTARLILENCPIRMGGVLVCEWMARG